MTPGQDESPDKLRRIHLPERFDGKSVLDVGAWDGFFSFEAERRGASKVVGIDPECWRDPPWGPNGWGTRQGFDLAHAKLRSRVETIDIDMPDISPETVGRFDVVLFLGVLYHLPDPWPVLAAVASVATERLIIETHVDMQHIRRPAAAYYPHDELASDESNYWSPNPALLVAQVRALGFTRIKLYRESSAYRVARSLYRRVKPPQYPAAQGRCVVHALR